MTLEDLREILESTGIPVAYRAWPEDAAPPLPYICYIAAYSNNFAADGVVYHKISHIQVELYTEKKELLCEAKVENALASFFWEKEEIYLDDEKCYEILYEIEV